MLARLAVRLRQFDHRSSLPGQPPRTRLTLGGRTAAIRWMEALCFVTSCMGRLASLQRTLGPMVEQPDSSCVVVDYSCPESAGDWVKANFPSVRVVRVPGQGRWHASAARNIGARRVDTPWICFVDSDVVLEPGFSATLLSTLQPGGFYRVCSTDRGLGGTFACARSDFERVGGYDEMYPCWGEEDNDL